MYFLEKRVEELTREVQFYKGITYELIKHVQDFKENIHTDPTDTLKMYQTLKNEYEASCRQSSQSSNLKFHSVKSSKKCMKHSMRSMTPNSIKASPIVTKSRLDLKENEYPASFKLSIMSCKEGINSNAFRETPRSQTPKPCKTYSRDMNIYQPPIKLNGRNTPSMRETPRKIPKYLQNVDSKIKGDVKKDVEMFKVMMKISGNSEGQNGQGFGEIGNSQSQSQGRASPCKQSNTGEMREQNLGYEYYRTQSKPESIIDRRQDRQDTREDIYKSQEKFFQLDRKDLQASKRQFPEHSDVIERKSLNKSKPPLFPIFEDTDKLTIHSAPSRQEEVSSYYTEQKPTQGPSEMFSQYQNLEDTFQKLDDKETPSDRLRLDSCPELHFDNEFETPRYPGELKTNIDRHKTTQSKKHSLEDTGDLLNIAEGFLKNPLIAHLASKGSISFSVEESPRNNCQSQPISSLIQLSLEQSQGPFRKKWEEATRNIGKEEEAPPIKWDDSKDLGISIPIKSDSSFDFNTSSAQFEILQKFSEETESKAVDSSADYSFLKSQYFNMRYTKKGPASELFSHRSSSPIMLETPSPSASIYDLEEYKLHPMYQDAHYSKYV